MEAFHTIAQANCPCGPVLDTSEILKDPHLIKRDFIIELEHPLKGKYKMPGCPIKMSKSQVDFTTSPLIGQHSEEVLREWLGYSQKDVSGLREEKAI